MQGISRKSGFCDPHAKPRGKPRKKPREKLKQRARKLAVKMLKTKYAKKPVTALSNSEKASLEKRLSKKGSLIDRMAKKLIKVVRKKEMERFRKEKG